MKEREALKLALEALKAFHYAMIDAGVLDRQEVLNQGFTAATAIKAALAQPEQEHVEWGVDWGPDGSSVSIIKRLADGGIEVVGWEYAPHPQQRTWVGLRDEEMKKVWYEMQNIMGWYSFQEIAKAIELELKDKNT